MICWDNVAISSFMKNKSVRRKTPTRCGCVMKSRPNIQDLGCQFQSDMKWEDSIHCLDHITITTFWIMIRTAMKTYRMTFSKSMLTLLVSVFQGKRNLKILRLSQLRQRIQALPVLMSMFIKSLLAISVFRPGNGHYATFNPMKEYMHPHDYSHVDHEFRRFVGKHGKKYDTAEEHEKRKSTFMQNLRFIHSKNRAKLGYSLGVNHLADKTKDELKALNGFRSSGVYNGRFYLSLSMKIQLTKKFLTVQQAVNHSLTTYQVPSLPFFPINTIGDYTEPWHRSRINRSAVHAGRSERLVRLRALSFCETVEIWFDYRNKLWSTVHGDTAITDAMAAKISEHINGCWKWAVFRLKRNTAVIWGRMDTVMFRMLLCRRR